jgi:hypothetical protein
MIVPLGRKHKSAANFSGPVICPGRGPGQKAGQLLAHAGRGRHRKRKIPKTC